jgi:LPXTG-motif cell wall-anchored protein
LVLDNHSKGSTKEKQAASPVIKTVAYSSVASAQTVTAKTVIQSVAKANLEGSAFTALPKTNQRPSKLLTISGVFVALLGFLAMPFKKGKL